MPRYFYTARTQEGQNQTGTLEAQDTHQLARMLKQEGLMLIKAELEEKRQKKKFEFNLPFTGVPLPEKMFFTRNLQVMISAGIPMPRAIDILATQVKSKKFKKALSNIVTEITKGKSLSDCLAGHDDIFSELFQSMVKVGEESGTLENVLKVLSLQMEREQDLRSKIQSAMIYPAVIISAMIGIGILMLVVVVPKLAETFEELGAELPITTKIVINFATFLSARWYLVIIFLFGLIFLFLQIVRTKAGKKLIDTFTLKLPIISPIIKNTNSAYTVRTLSSLISAGIALPRSLEITSGTLGNVYYKKALNEAAEKVRKGEKLSETLKPYNNIYPATVIQMISVGEETGETSGILAKLAEFYESEVSNSTKNLASVIEPVLMIIIGAAVGFFAISMIQPMYSMLGSIK
jgi:type IV pilus assembly protein PilC